MQNSISRTEVNTVQGLQAKWGQLSLFMSPALVAWSVWSLELCFALLCFAALGGFILVTRILRHLQVLRRHYHPPSYFHRHGDELCAILAKFGLQISGVTLCKLSLHRTGIDWGWLRLRKKRKQKKWRKKHNNLPVHCTLLRNTEQKQTNKGNNG